MHLFRLFAIGFALLCFAWSPGNVSAKSPTFRPHVVNADSTFSACAALDVNRDGKTDIVSGGFWYEAPNWKKHFLREVEMIRGRYDDYSNLPLDVNADGWTDLVSCNYRSQSIYWVRNPGPSNSPPWARTVVAQPGAMETGRLVDVDGDGRLDVLPNGMKFAAWWEVVLPRKHNAKPSWKRHDLPPELAGHGVGFGDINGDGRGDMVGPRGWAEAPKDPRKDRWIWRGDFQLHRDCGIPILVHDADDDGDNDIIWGRGHQTGLYWMEQVKRGDSRQWVKHVIDTSWSQPHSLLLADIDNDGRQDVVAGKRYMGHDGKDLGEFDPLVIYWYSFVKQHRTWRRGLVSRSMRIGFGLDPKAADLDGDGDTDLLAAGRSGLYWLENLAEQESAATEPEKHFAHKDHSKLLLFADRHEQLRPVTSAAEWATRRANILRSMQEVMGPLPDPSRRVPLEVKTISEQETRKYRRLSITYAAEPGDRVPAYLLLPKNADGPRPAMLCLHQTTAIGKGSPAGLGDRKSLHYAHELAGRGYVCIVPDYPSFGDYEYDFAADRYISGTMKAIWNNIRAIDVLESLPEVHPDRIGAIGHSLGGHNALFTAPFDLRIKAVVTSCGFTAFHHYYGGDLKGWTSDRYIPRIRTEYQNDPDKVPFDFYEVLAAIAPRAIFVNAPVHDGNFENMGVRKVVAGAGEVFGLLRAKGKLQAVHPDSGHDFPDRQRREAYDWLDKNLR